MWRVFNPAEGTKLSLREGRKGRNEADFIGEAQWGKRVGTLIKIRYLGWSSIRQSRELEPEVECKWKPASGFEMGK